jgi:hypothetical protein
MHWVTGLVRRAGLDGNPLRRGSDKAQAWIRLGLLAVFLAAGPVAAFAVGNWAYDSGVSAARAQQSTEYQVRAELLRKAPVAAAYPVAGNAVAAWVQARWTAPDGAARTGDVWAAAGARDGSAVTVWTDASGDLVSQPLSHSQILSRVISFTAVTPVALAIVLLSLSWATGRLLDRRRMAAWEMDWDSVEPQWTRRPH